MRHHSKDYFVIDLFAGCGGLSEGFTQAGFKVISHIEMDKWACETLKTRCLYYKLKERKKLYWYFKYLTDEKPRTEILEKFPDIEKEINLEVIKATFGSDPFEEIVQQVEKTRDYYGTSEFHVLLGGPPCQPYSLAGRSRDPQRMVNDERHFLFEHYLRMLTTFQPDFFVFENVPGLITAKAKDEEIFKRILNDFSLLKPSYNVAPTYEELSKNPKDYILNSSRYSVPQNRKRIFLIGYRKNLETKNPSVRKVFQKILEYGRKTKGVLTVTEAIGDLPAVNPKEGSDSWYGPYMKDDNITPYQNDMRKNCPGIVNFKARSHMKSDLDRYKYFIEKHLNGSKTATLKDLQRERPDLMPDHNHIDKFLDRFRVQWWNRSASTITAHIRKDGHYYIHPDIHQCRSFTVREAARCQSFPDNYKFEGPRTEQFKQVGNAVPPRLARVIATIISKELKEIYEKRTSMEHS